MTLDLLYSNHKRWTNEVKQNSNNVFLCISCIGSRNYSQNFASFVSWTKCWYIYVELSWFYNLAHHILLTLCTIFFWSRNPLCHLIYIKLSGIHYLLDWQGTPSRYSDQIHISHIANFIINFYELVLLHPLEFSI